MHDVTTVVRANTMTLQDEIYVLHVVSSCLQPLADTINLSRPVYLDFECGYILYLSTNTSGSSRYNPYMTVVQGRRHAFEIGGAEVKVERKCVRTCAREKF